MKLMSLFDGSGGFPLAGSMFGIEPKYASEIEPYPIAVTTSRFPNLKHLGSVTDIKGSEIEPVDVITFGSPCFPAGTLVLTETGYKNIEELKVGDKVFTHKGNWKPIIDIGYKYSPTVEVKGNHYGLITTPNHPFYSGVEEWTPAEDMAGKKCASPNIITTEAKLEISAEEAYQCGMSARVINPHNFFIPAEGFSASLEVRQALLKGLLFDRPEDELKDEDCYFSKSKAVAFGVGLLAQTLGYSVRYERREGYVFAHMTKAKANGDIHYWYDVDEVAPFKSEEKVYNITVDEDHSYIVEGFVVHNCQDLSVAGKRAGLKHEENGDDETTRSGLFMEAIRIIKEMREATNGKYPRFAVWENVPGAFSSNKGEDFRKVLEEFIKINEPSAVMPDVPQKGWSYYDWFRGDGWSVAYRTMDAQYWGVPQRRRRIYLVADFASERAGEILFKQDGLRGYFEKGRTPWQGTSCDAQGSVGTNDNQRANGVDFYNLCCTGDIARTLSTSSGGYNEHNPCVIEDNKTTYALDQQGGKGMANYAENVMMTLCSDSHGTPHAVAYENGIGINGNKAATIDASYYKGCGMRQGIEREIVAFAQNQRDEVRDLGKKAGALQAEPGMKQQTFIAESAIGCDQYNGDLCGDKSSTLGVNCGISTGRNGILVPTTFEPGILKREGGHVYEGVSGTLRANAGDNQLSVAYCESEVSGYDGYNQCLTGEVSKTITSGRNDTHNIPCVVHTNQNACGVDFYNQSLTGDVAKSITSAATDADHIPCVVHTDGGAIGFDKYNQCSTGNVSATLRTPGGGDNYPIVCMATQQGGAEIRQDDKAPCLTASAGMSGNNQPVIAYSFDSLNSNSMKSSNPLSGCRQVDVAKCLDTTIPEPSKNQGGMAIVEQKVINLNKDDFQSKQVLDPQGIAPAIYAGECRRGGGECYIVDKMTDVNQEMCLIDSIGGQAERGWSGEIAPCLKATHYKSAPCVAFAAGFKPNQGAKANGLGYEDEMSPTLLAGQESGVVCVYNGENITSPLNKTNPQADDPCHTLGTDSRNYLVYCLQGNGIDRADTAGCNGKGWKEDFSYTLNTIDRPAVCYAVENHPADSRVNLDDSGTCQCLTGRMGTGGGNVPMVLSVDMGGGKSSCVIQENIAPTLCTTHYGEPVVAHEATMANGKEVVGTLSASQGQKLWLGNQEAFSGEFHVLEKVPCDYQGTVGTLCACDYKGVNNQLVADDKLVNDELVSPVYCVGNGQVDQAYLQEKVGALNCMHEQQAVVLDRAFYNQGENAKFEPQLYTDGTVPPLMARGPAAVSVRYVVRRLTPTECARLQGFPDGWMYPIVKEDFTDEEYKFWLDVRNTHAAINNKQVKDYTKDAMVKWYNKLFTDSSAYKMWGNGIALPNALYVMQGITDLVNDGN